MAPESKEGHRYRTAPLRPDSGTSHRQVHPVVDVVVVGAGAAGLYAALVASEAGASVRLVSSSPLDQSASYRAQGGLAAALDSADSVDLHLKDTIVAGRGAVRESAARILCEEAPERVHELLERGIGFDTDGEGGLALGLEGGHSRRRVVHAGGSATGRRVAEALSQAALRDERITVHERCSAIRLLVAEGSCTGVVTNAGDMPASATLLATGGAAALWKRTTNPRGAVGSGLLLAHEAGAELADLELLQFHPTALVSEGPLDGFLVSEAVRGEGALLLTQDGERFVEELAPRDVVARATHEELERSGRDVVMLDMRSVEPHRFPNITDALMEAGLDPQRDLIPVAPAAHYMIGGILSDSDGRSTLPGLYSLGECACTGVHGANRLASNSLSECFVFGRRAALAATAEPSAPSSRPAPGPQPDAPARVSEDTRAALWRWAGIVRNREGLEQLADDPHPLARLVARSALAREESRGCHLRSDFKSEDARLDRGHFVAGPSGTPRLEHWD
jgi:L-aspartate oxidase